MTQSDDKPDAVRARREERRNPGYARLQEEKKRCPDPQLSASEKCLDARDCGWREACADWNRSKRKAKDAGL